MIILLFELITFFFFCNNIRHNLIFLSRITIHRITFIPLPGADPVHLDMKSAQVIIRFCLILCQSLTSISRSWACNTPVNPLPEVTTYTCIPCSNESTCLCITTMTAYKQLVKWTEVLPPHTDCWEQQRSFIYQFCSIGEIFMNFCILCFCEIWCMKTVLQWRRGPLEKKEANVEII